VNQGAQDAEVQASPFVAVNYHAWVATVERRQDCRSKKASITIVVVPGEPNLAGLQRGV
jgi:hypothetical protein